MKKQKYSDYDKYVVIQCHESGMIDKEIHQYTGYGMSYIVRITTEYWEQKMKSKQQNK